MSKDKSIFFIGQKGIGKTTTILYQFYQNKEPFFYINLKYFEKSLDELEKTQIIDFEKNNIFRPKYEKFLSNEFKQIINYEIEIHHFFQQINNIIYNNTEKDGIKYISLLIQILSLVYKKLKAIEINNNPKLEIIQDDINKIIDKIKLLKLPESIIKK